MGRSRKRTGASRFARNADFYWFTFRVILLAAVLGVPILGTSFTLVSGLSADILTAKSEHAELASFQRVIDIVALIESVHRDLAARPHRADVRDERAVERAFTAAQEAYAKDTNLPKVRVVLDRWQSTWRQAENTSTIAGVDTALDALNDIAGEIDDNSPLDFDPNFAVQNIVSTVLRQTPRSIVAIGRTADAVTNAAGSELSAHFVKDIATHRALEIQPLARVFSDLEFVETLEPDLRSEIRAATAAAASTTTLFETRVDKILTTFAVDSADRLAIEQLGRRAIDAHLRMWSRNRATADSLVIGRYHQQIYRRRMVVGVSLLAVVLGTIAITLSGRYMARRDRIELASAKLESDKLRAELQQITVERALRLQEAQFRSVFENTDLGIVIFEHSGTILQHNAAVSEMLDDRMDDILNEHASAVATFSAGREPFIIEQLLVRNDGSTQWLAMTFSGVYDNGECQMVVLLIRDTTEEKLLQQGLIFAANHDGLTGIANRMRFESDLSALMANTSEDFALLYIDLDKFKPVNDTHGHAAGDRVLVETAQRLRSALSHTDIAARLGGDEFAAIVRGESNDATLESITRRIVTMIAAPIRFGQQSLEVTASVGVARRSPTHRTGVELERDADKALYRVKRLGGNGYEIEDATPTVWAPETR